MKRIIPVVLATFCYGALMAQDSSVRPVERMGVYDSRSVAIAFVGSEVFNQWMAPLYAEMRRAKELGDRTAVQAVDSEAWARQDRLHLQGFSTTSVDDILLMVKDRLPAVMAAKGVEVLVSRWDKEQLARYPSVARVDVTGDLVDLFEPSEQQREHAMEVQKHKPVSPERIKRMKD